MRDVIGEGLRLPGHFSAGILSEGLLFVSGQPPTDLATGELAQGGFREQARQCLRNVERVVELAGGTRDDIVKTTVWLHDWSDYAALNDAYAEFFPTRPPARSTVQGSRPFGQRLAIEAIAVVARR